ncbi:MAG: hypothetical protein O2960_20110 [Verrucomicrobia bacterium]|nr:hypothetical protein [Verrucomicrobiota bacterium]
MDTDFQVMNRVGSYFEGNARIVPEPRYQFENAPEMERVPVSNLKTSEHPVLSDSAHFLYNLKRLRLVLRTRSRSDRRCSLTG